MTRDFPAAPALKEEKADLLRRLLDGLDRETLLWLSGYMAGAAGGSAAAPNALATTAAAANSSAQAAVTIVFGSQTGHARGIAESLARQLQSAAIETRIFGADAYPNRELKGERLLLLIISTHGDGDPPDHARGWLDFLGGRRAPDLRSLQFAVLALGDSSYPRFCHVGRAADARLEALGAKRWLPLAEADVDFEPAAGQWVERVLQEARKLAPSPGASVTVAPAPSVQQQADAGWTRSRPFSAELYVNQRITGRQSDRDVRHVELLLEGSGIRYEPGASLGIWPEQDEALVGEILDRLGLDGAEGVTIGNETLPLSRWLEQRREITLLTRPFLAAHAEKSGSPALRLLLEPGQSAQLAHTLATWQLPDLLVHHPARWPAAELVAALRPLAPRLYSIASSPALSDGEEVHLTVGVVDYRFEEQHRWGAASHHIASLALGARVSVYAEANERFRLPGDGDRDIIMIGPGTGVAPFRAFVQHRVATGARGRNWLLFGNRHFRSEFLYQLEWQSALAAGQLHRLDLAFSRDGAQRIYVQHRMQQAGKELYGWIQGGAHVYVCGDAKRMARDVEAALAAIARQHGGLSGEGAQEWLAQLASEARYVRDVY